MCVSIGVLPPPYGGGTFLKVPPPAIFPMGDTKTFPPPRIFPMGESDFRENIPPHMEGEFLKITSNRPKIAHFSAAGEFFFQLPPYGGEHTLRPPHNGGE